MKEIKVSNNTPRALFYARYDQMRKAVLYSWRQSIQPPTLLFFFVLMVKQWLRTVRVTLSETMLHKCLIVKWATNKSLEQWERVTMRGELEVMLKLIVFNHEIILTSIRFERNDGLRLRGRNDSYRFFHFAKANQQGRSIALVRAETSSQQERRWRRSKPEEQQQAKEKERD